MSALAAIGAHVSMPVGPVVLVVHVVFVHELPELAAAGEQADAGVGPVATVLHVVAV